MIGYIKGTVEEIFADYILLEANSIGYRIYVPSSFTDFFSYGDEVKVYTYLSVREDALTLYGFKSRDELDIYKLLLSVSGVGPKAAMGIMSALPIEEFRYAMIASDYKKLASAPGIGKKTAQKIILELKDKFDAAEALEKNLGSDAGDESLRTDAAADTVEALEALGYSPSDALKAVKAALADGAEKESGALLKEALKYL